MVKKKITSITSLLIALSLVFCLFVTGCSSDKDDDKEEKITVASTNGRVSRYKTYKFEQYGNCKATVYLRYREGSDLLAEIEGKVTLYDSRENLSKTLSDFGAIKEKIEALGSADASLEYHELSSGDIEVSYSFVNLDQPGNKSVAEIVEDFVGVTANADGTFNIESSEDTFVAGGYVLVDSN